MKLNKFYTPAGSEDPSPNRVYARLDRLTNIESGSGRFAVFDGVDAKWYDDYRTSMFPPSLENGQSFIFDVPLVVVEYRRKKDSINAYGFHNKLLRRSDVKDGASDWFEIRLSNAGNPDWNAQVYTSMFDDPENKYKRAIVEGISPVGFGLGKSLDDSFSLASVGFASKAELRRALKRIGTVDFATVYDVGQGSCAGLCGEDGSVRAYLDFGGGIYANRHSFPGTLNHFCFTNNPPIILSHWDYDHWSSVHRDEDRAFQMDWIVPYQVKRDGRADMGPTHIAFARQVELYGRLLWWPTNLGRLTVGQITVRKCTGHGRNHSGLAVIVSDDESDATEHLLFPGDARYTVVPGYDKYRLTSVVVPHHGGDMRNRYAPPYPECDHSRLVYSYGADNQFGHPREITRTRHRDAGWPQGVVSNSLVSHVEKSGNRFSRIKLQTPGYGRVELHTATVRRACQKDPGHIILRLGAKPKELPQLPCSGWCQLRPRV